MYMMGNFLHHFLRRYFGFSKRESRGFLFVFPMLVVLYLLPLVLDKAFSAKHERGYQLYLKEAEAALSLISSRSEVDSVLQEKKDTTKQKAVQPSKRMERLGTPVLNRVAFHETDSVLLQMVSGVGPVISSRIVKFRESMGGFHQPEQLLEVYGLTPEVAERIYSTFPFEAVVTKKIPLNSGDAKELSQHPYISASEGKVIVAYRQQHGSYQQASDLLKIKVFNQAWLERIIPYLEW
jgi:DNA uptake protein ComE-like DNA-binding protein